jgi:NYN domain
VSRTIVYIDGFNLYYRALKGTAHKWLDIAALSQAVLPNTAQIAAINYYTAHVSGRLDPTAPARQHSYLRAIGTLPNVAITYGNFLVSKKWSGLVQPAAFKPPVTLPPGASPQVAYVWKTEEKGSDVNIGVHLVRDAFMGRFDEAAVLTNDTDLAEALRIVTKDVGLPVTLLAPNAQPATSLVAAATHVRHVKPYVGACQLPNQVTLANGRIVTKPSGW